MQFNEFHNRFSFSLSLIHKVHRIFPFAFLPKSDLLTLTKYLSMRNYSCRLYARLHLLLSLLYRFGFFFFCFLCIVYTIIFFLNLLFNVQMRFIPWFLKLLFFVNLTPFYHPTEFMQGKMTRDLSDTEIEATQKDTTKLKTNDIIHKMSIANDKLLSTYPPH